MIFLIHGADTYRSRRELEARIAAFRKRAAGEYHITQIDAAEDAARLHDIGRMASLFAADELIVIENIFGAEADDAKRIKEMLAVWEEDPMRTVVFYERKKIAASDALMKAIAKRSSEVKEFEQLKIGAATWVLDEAERRGLGLTKQDAVILARRFGEDTWALANEMAKVADGWPLAREDGRETIIWNFTDAFFTNRRASFRMLSEVLDAGEEPIAVVGALAGSLRSLALVWHGIQTKKMSAATETMHPFVVRKNEAIAKKVDRAALERAFRWLVSCDREQKSGASPAPLPLVKLVLR